MQPTPEDRRTLRQYLDEVVPAGGTDAQTMFSDQEIDRLLIRTASVEEAAYVGWMTKAIRVFRPGTLVSSRVGNESYTWVSPQELRKAAMEMADWYRSLIPAGGHSDNISRGVSILLSPVEPVVFPATYAVYDPEHPMSDDVSRLWER